MSLRRQWKGTSLLLAVGLMALSAQFLSGCGEPGEVESAAVAEQRIPLFVDFQREYAPPTENYFYTDKIQSLLPDNEEHAPLIIHPYVRQFHPEILANSRVSEELIEIPWEVLGDDEYEKIHKDDVLISGLEGADLWWVVTEVEETDDFLRIHAEKGEPSDVIMQGDFYLEIESGYVLPDNFNLLDVYIRPQSESYRQIHQQQRQEEDEDEEDPCEGLPEPCTCLTPKVTELLASTDSDDVKWLNTRRNRYNNNVKAPFTWWLNQRQEEERDLYLQLYFPDEEDEDDDGVVEEPPYEYQERNPLFDAARNSCVKVHKWSAQKAQNDYISAFNAGHDGTSPIPPSVVCFEEWLHDELEREARAEAGDSSNFELDDDDDDGAIVDDLEVGGADGTLSMKDICDMVDFSGGLTPEEEAEREKGVDEEMGEAFADLEGKLEMPGYEAAAAADQTCVDNCASAENPSQCASECPVFKKCSKDFCFSFEKLTVSYRPKFTFRIKLRPWKGSITAEFSGPLTFRLGLLLTANAEYSFDISRSLRIGVPKLSFNFGPIRLGLFIVAGFGVSFSFDAKGAIRAEYEMVRTAGVKAGGGYWSLKPKLSPVWKTPKSPEWKIETTGGIGAHFQAWAEGGVELVAGSDSNKIWVTPLRVVLSASAAIRPPSCPYEVALFLANEAGIKLNFKVFRFTKSGSLSPPTYLFRTSGSLEDHMSALKHICGVSIKPPVYDDTIGYCALDADCDGGVCVGGTCVDTGDLRMTLRWNDRVDLNLWVITPSGEMHSVAGGKQENFTRWDCGGTCADSAEFEDEYVENIVFDDPEPGVYTFYVAHNLGNPLLSGADTFPYTVEIESEDGSFERIKGEVNPNFEQMPMTYHFCVPSGPNGEGCPN